MKKLTVYSFVGLLAVLSGSCTNYYDQQPEGYATQTVPVGYTLAVIGGISYYHNHDHYYRYWPGSGYVVVRPPHGRPPYHRPPSRPPHGGKPKPEHPIAKPPGNRPPQGRPPTIQPTPYPVTRPSNPGSRPSTRPTTRPAARPMPSVQRGGGGGRRSRR